MAQTIKFYIDGDHAADGTIHDGVIDCEAHLGVESKPILWIYRFIERMIKDGNDCCYVDCYGKDDCTISWKIVD